MRSIAFSRGSILRKETGSRVHAEFRPISSSPAFQEAGIGGRVVDLSAHEKGTCSPGSKRFLVAEDAVFWRMAAAEHERPLPAPAAPEDGFVFEQVVGPTGEGLGQRAAEKEYI